VFKTELNVKLVKQSNALSFQSDVFTQERERKIS
jgi:hypothetical protein